MKAALFKLCRAFHRSYFGGHNVLGERRRIRRQTDKSKRSLFLFICGGGRGAWQSIRWSEYEHKAKTPPAD